MISVIVPVYNVEKYLPKCIESILHQNYRELEIILVDDGSTDNCPDICDEYARADDRIKVIHKENGGLSSARNAGIEIAQGDYIAFVDSDDYILPNMYERMLWEMQASEANIVMCGYLNVNESGFFLDKADIPEWIGSGTEFLKENGLKNSYVWNKLYRRELFAEIRFPEGKFFEDMFIMHQIFRKAEKVSLIPDAFYVYLQRKGSIAANLVSVRRVDFIEALINRLVFLLKIGAEENVLFSFIMQVYGTWSRFCRAGMLKDPAVSDAWKRHYAEFRRVTKRISVSWSIYHKLILSLMRFSPVLLRFLVENYRRVRALASLGKRTVLRHKWSAKARKFFRENGAAASGLPGGVYESEYEKYRSALQAECAALNVTRMEAFLSDDVVLKTDHLSLADDPCVPTVVLVVKNELERIKLFYDHYRKLGVHQFVVLDNNSDDGTFEYLSEQQDTRVYQVCTGFQTHRKEGWIEKLLALTGYHRWYIVVDSDELLDYIGSETHPAESLIRKVHTSGLKRVCGYMVDMYAKEPLFSDNCETDNIPDHFRYFDKEGYYTKGPRKDSGNYILVGPRLRMFGSVLVLSKQAMFYFDENTLYRDCHSLFPVVPISEMPTLFVLRHYKFLHKDYAEYQRRIKEKCFYRGSIEYKTIMDQLEKNGEASMYYYESSEYVNSDSLRCLPYLEEVNW